MTLALLSTPCFHLLRYSHECGWEGTPLRAPDPTCARCQGSFVEEVRERAQQYSPRLSRHELTFTSSLPCRSHQQTIHENLTKRMMMLRWHWSSTTGKEGRPFDSSWAGEGEGEELWATREAHHHRMCRATLSLLSCRRWGGIPPSLEEHRRRELVSSRRRPRPTSPILMMSHWVVVVVEPLVSKVEPRGKVEQGRSPSATSREFVRLSLQASKTPELTRVHPQHVSRRSLRRSRTPSRRPPAQQSLCRRWPRRRRGRR